MASVRVGLYPPVGQRAGGMEELHATLARTGEGSADHLCVGDHVSFFVGAGSDGLITAASMLGELRTQLTAAPKRLPQEDAWNR